MKNYAYKLSGEVGVRILSTVFLLILARTVGTAEFGVYSTAFAFASIFVIFIDLGTNPIVTREIARNPLKRSQIIASVNLLKTATTVIMVLGLWFTTRWIGFPEEKTHLIRWFGWVAAGTALTEYFCAILTGLEQMAVEAVLKVISKAVVIFSALFVLLHTRSLLTSVQTMSYCSILSILIGCLIVRSRVGTMGIQFDPAYLHKLLKQSLPIFGSWAFLILYDSQDILILNFFKVADYDIGLFVAAIKIIDVLKIFPVLLASSFFPSLARHAHQSREEFIRRAKKLLAYSTLAFPVLTLIAYTLTPLAIRMLYGQAYMGSVSALRLLLVGFILMAINIVLLQVLIAADKEKQSLGGSALVCIGNGMAAILLVPHFGIIGTCYALIVSEVVYFGFQGFLIRTIFASA